MLRLEITTIGSGNSEKVLTMTWNMKYLVIKLSSTPLRLGIPSNLASKRKNIGSSIIKTASNTGGKIPFV